MPGPCGRRWQSRSAKAPSVAAHARESSEKGGVYSAYYFRMFNQTERRTGERIAGTDHLQSAGYDIDVHALAGIENLLRHYIPEVIEVWPA